jgi:hypothetical protein
VQYDEIAFLDSKRAALFHGKEPGRAHSSYYFNNLGLALGNDPGSSPTSTWEKVSSIVSWFPEKPAGRFGNGFDESIAAIATWSKERAPRQPANQPPDTTVED